MFYNHNCFNSIFIGNNVIGVMRKLRYLKTNFKIEELIPKNHLNIYLSFISIISVVKKINLEDIKADIENYEFESNRLIGWLSWN